MIKLYQIPIRIVNDNGWSSTSDFVNREGYNEHEKHNIIENKKKKICRNMDYVTLNYDL